MKPPLTREEAQAAGYEGYAVHMPHRPCPSDENPKVYCASCAPLDEWGLNRKALAALTKATRDDDRMFESGRTGGGGTRHWLRDCFLPALADEGLVVRWRE